MVRYTSETSQAALTIPRATSAPSIVSSHLFQTTGSHGENECAKCGAQPQPGHSLPTYPPPLFPRFSAGSSSGELRWREKRGNPSQIEIDTVPSPTVGMFPPSITYSLP